MTTDRTTASQLSTIAEILSTPDFPSQEELAAAGIEHVLHAAGERAVYRAVDDIRDRMADEGININIYDDAYIRRFGELEQAIYEAALTEARSLIKRLAADITADYEMATSEDLSTLHKDTTAGIIRHLRSPLVAIARGGHTTPNARRITSAISELSWYKAARAQ